MKMYVLQVKSGCEISAYQQLKERDFDVLLPMKKEFKNKSYTGIPASLIAPAFSTVLFDIDHIDGNKMNNLRANLRLCSHQQNMFNQKKRCTNSSGYMGVSFSKNAKKYEVYIHYNGKKKNLGLYTSAIDAAKARDKAAIKYFGKYAKLNLPMDVIAV